MCQQDILTHISSESDFLLQGMPGPTETLQHRPYRIPQNRACALCTITKSKTKLGWARKSYYKCEACNVPLCVGETECFTRYHNLQMQNPELVLFKRKISVSKPPTQY